MFWEFLALLLLSSVQFLTSSAAKDLHTQVKGVSELHREDAQVASSDQPTQPSSNRSPAQHPDFKDLNEHNSLQERWTAFLIISTQKKTHTFLMYENLVK